MRMTVVHVRIVGVNVGQRHVHVRVSMWFGAVPSRRMGMLVVRIMRVGVRMFLLFVCVQVPVVLGEVQPDPGPHDRSRSDELPRNGIALDQHC